MPRVQPHPRARMEGNTIRLVVDNERPVNVSRRRRRTINFKAAFSWVAAVIVEGFAAHAAAMWSTPYDPTQEKAPNNRANATSAREKKEHPNLPRPGCSVSSQGTGGSAAAISHITPNTDESCLPRTMKF